jgi:hypothetical protein
MITVAPTPKWVAGHCSTMQWLPTGNPYGMHFEQAGERESQNWVLRRGDASVARSAVIGGEEERALVLYSPPVRRPRLSRALTRGPRVRTPPAPDPPADAWIRPRPSHGRLDPAAKLPPLPGPWTSTTSPWTPRSGARSRRSSPRRAADSPSRSSSSAAG